MIIKIPVYIDTDLTGSPSEIEHVSIQLQDEFSRILAESIGKKSKTDIPSLKKKINIEIISYPIALKRLLSPQARKTRESSLKKTAKQRQQ